MKFALLTHEDVPKTLYHYTSLESLLAIVQSKRLRASNIRFLNDRSESLHLKENVVNMLRGRVSDTKDQEIVGTILRTLDANPKQSHFVASLSEHRDLLSQWRAYCPSGLGVSIGFSSDCLNDQWIADPSEGEPFFMSAPLQKVRYYSPEDQRGLEEVVEKLLTHERTRDSCSPERGPNIAALCEVVPFIKDGLLERAELEHVIRLNVAAITAAEGEAKWDRLYEPGETIAAWIFNLAPFVKHHAFEEEGEWRKLVSKDSRPMPAQKFRSGKSTLIPFVEIMLDATTVGAARVPRKSYFINEVVLGPTPTPELSLEALTSLFASIGHPEVEIVQSRVPYRDW